MDAGGIREAQRDLRELLKRGQRAAFVLRGQGQDPWDMNLERRVAVKRLNEDLGDDPAELERFIAEAKTVAALKLPNIVAVHEAFLKAVS